MHIVTVYVTNGGLCGIYNFLMSRLGIGLEIYFYGYVKVAVILLLRHFGPLLIYWSAILVAICEDRTLRLGTDKKYYTGSPQLCIFYNSTDFGYV